MVRLLILVKKAEWQNLTVPKMFTETAKRLPGKVMFYFQDETWTFQQVEEYSNRVANFFLSQNMKKGDRYFSNFLIQIKAWLLESFCLFFSVAIFMENRPEYVATWLGLSKIGVIPALINYNLKQKALLHTVQVANSKAIIYGVELASQVSEIIQPLKNGSVLFPTFSSGNPSHKQASVPGTVDLNEALGSASKDPVPKEIQDSIGFKEKLLYIYTSGTTGLPKAAVIKHSR